VEWNLTTDPDSGNKKEIFFLRILGKQKRELGFARAEASLPGMWVVDERRRDHQPGIAEELLTGTEDEPAIRPDGVAAAAIELRRANGPMMVEPAEK
jgi:hypothetical protein